MGCQTNVSARVMGSKIAGSKSEREQQLEAEITCLEAQVRVLKELIIGVQMKAVESAAHSQDDEVHPAMFTAKQHAVIQAIHQGWSTQRMADALETTESTVKGHIKSVMDKTGVRTRKQLITKTAGLMEWEPGEYERVALIPVNWASTGGSNGSRELLTRRTR